MLIGTCYHNIDDKGRMIFPAKFREDLGMSFIVTPWTNGCLGVFSPAVFQNMLTRLETQGISETEDFTRMFCSRAEQVDTDKQGRILIPAQLRKLAELKRDVAVIGVKDRVEIWDRERWTQWMDQRDSDHFGKTLAGTNL